MSDVFAHDPNPAREAKDDFKALEPLKDNPVSPAVVVASIALNLSLKYHDMCLVKDGTLYQQYKVEQRNIKTMHLSDIMEVAKQFEAHLMAADKRIAKLIVDAIEFHLEDDEHDEPAAPDTTA